MKFSVLLCTYNADEKSIIYTLDSLVSQTLKDMEIIICDDGSVDPKEALYRSYFTGRGFEPFRFSFCPVNGGTVRNMQKGMELAEGDYIKPIGAGDALADGNVLKDMYALMSSERGILGYGPMKLFTVQGEERVFRDVQVPVSGDIYAKGSTALAKRRMIGYGDNISGSQLFYEAGYFKQMLAEVSKSAVYMEDLGQYLALLQEKKFSFLDRPVILYESAAGISTAGSSHFAELLAKDREGFLVQLQSLYPEEKSIRIRKRMEFIDRTSKNRAAKLIRKTLADPKWLSFRIDASKHDYIV